MDNAFVRKCPVCGEEILYKTKKCQRQAERANRKCRKCADDSTRKTTRNENWRKTHSRALQQAWSDPENTLNSEEYRTKLSESQVRRWNETSIDEKRRLGELHKRSWESSPDRRAATIERCRKRALYDESFRKKFVSPLAKISRATLCEKQLMPIMKKFGFEFNVFEPVAGIFPDFFNPERKIAIEIFGDWWHAHPSLDSTFAAKYSGFHPRLKMTPEKIRERDAQRIAKLEIDGIHCIVIWESEILKSKVVDLDRLFEILEKNDVK